MVSFKKRHLPKIIERKRSQKAGLYREGYRSLGGPSSPTPRGRRGRPLLEGTAFSVAALRSPSGGWPSLLCCGRLPTPHSVQKVFKELRTAASQRRLKSPMRSQARASRGPGVGDSGLRARFRASAPLPVAERLRSGRPAAPGEDARRPR